MFDSHSLRPAASFRRASRMLLAGAMFALSACGAGSDDPGVVPKPMTATQAAEDLVGPAAHPGALVVQVTDAGIDVQVRGVRRAGGASVAPDDRFAVGSLTKALTATLAGIAVQDGLLTWDTKLLDVLPEFAAEARAEYASVTLRDLLAHRSGLFPAVTEEQIAMLPELEGTARERRLQLVSWSLRRAPIPGYSNGGYVAAAAMLERVTSLDYEGLLQSRLFAPLGASVAFGAPGATGGPLGHASSDGRSWTAIAVDDPRAQYPEFANPAGGALLRGSDVGAFLALHLQALRGKQGLLVTPATARTLHTAVQGGYALGWMEGKGADNAALTWHNGSDDFSYYALMSVSTASGVAAAAFVNGLSPATEQALSGVIAQLLLRPAS